MRACRTAVELAAAWESVRRTAGASFGTAGVFLERLDHRRPARRGAGVRRRHGPGRHARRPRLLPAAPPPEGLRGGARARPAGRRPHRHRGRRARPVRLGRLPLRRHRRVRLRRRARGGRVPRGQHPPAGRAPGDRGGLRASTSSRGCCAWRRATRPSSATDLAPRGARRRGPGLRRGPRPRPPAQRRHRDRRSGSPTASASTPGSRRAPRSTTHYDPLLAKVITVGDRPRRGLGRPGRRARRHPRRRHRDEPRAAARRRARRRRPRRDPPHRHAGRRRRRRPAAARSCVPGMLTTVQDWPGRTGLWHVGVPPSGPMDDLSFRLGNRALGNPEGAPGLECTLAGPALRFRTRRDGVVTGAPAPVTVDGVPVPQWEPVDVPAGGVLDVGTPDDRDAHATCWCAAASTCRPCSAARRRSTSAGSAGTAGGALRAGDVLPLPPATATRRRDRGRAPGRSPSARERPALTDAWEIGALEGPHAAPEFFTPDDIDGVLRRRRGRCTSTPRAPACGSSGPSRRGRGRTAARRACTRRTSTTPRTPSAPSTTPATCRSCSGPDGPSLGGFVCPATVAVGQMWKLGQLRPGDTVRFVPVDEAQAATLRAAPAHAAGPVAPRRTTTAACSAGVGAEAHRPEVTYRRSGRRQPARRVRRRWSSTSRCGCACTRWPRRSASASRPTAAGRPAAWSTSPRASGPCRCTSTRTSCRCARALDLRARGGGRPARDRRARRAEPDRAPAAVLGRPGDPRGDRALHGRRARRRPVVPVEHRVHPPDQRPGLASTTCYRTVFDADYLVLGLGDVYLGAPVATPLDPRHRLVTTKYNPARTWTPENAVGIGGAYLCIYGMEGPGGYQFVGRTVQVWSTHSQRGAVRAGHAVAAAVLRPHQWYPVGAEELLDLRADAAAGRLDLRIERRRVRARRPRARSSPTTPASIAEFRARQAAAFGAERDAWAAAGEFDRTAEPAVLAGGRWRARLGGRRRRPAGVGGRHGAVRRDRVPGRRAARRRRRRGTGAARAGGDEDGGAARRARRRAGHRGAGVARRPGRARAGRRRRGAGGGGVTRRSRPGRACGAGSDGATAVRAALARGSPRSTGRRSGSTCVPRPTCSPRPRRSTPGRRRRARPAARRPRRRGEGQHRRRRAADDRGLPGVRDRSGGDGRDRRRPAPRRGRRRPRHDQPRPVRDRSGRDAQPVRRGPARDRTRIGSPAGRAAGRRSRSRSGSPTSPSAPTPPARAGCRRRCTGSSGSSRPAAWCRSPASSPRAGRSTACRCSPARSVSPSGSLGLLAGPDGADPPGAPARRPSRSPTGAGVVGVPASAALGDARPGLGRGLRPDRGRAAGRGRADRPGGRRPRSSPPRACSTRARSWPSGTPPSASSSRRIPTTSTRWSAPSSARPATCRRTGCSPTSRRSTGCGCGHAPRSRASTPSCCRRPRSTRRSPRCAPTRSPSTATWAASPTSRTCSTSRRSRSRPGRSTGCRSVSSSWGRPSPTRGSGRSAGGSRARGRSDRPPRPLLRRSRWARRSARRSSCRSSWSGRT